MANVTAHSATPQVQRQKAAILDGLTAWLVTLPEQWGEYKCDDFTPEMVCIFLYAVWVCV